MATTTARLVLDSAAGSLLTSVLAIDDTMTLTKLGSATGLTETTGLARVKTNSGSNTILLDFGLAGGGGSPGASNKTEEYVRTHGGAPYLLTKKIKAQE